jgi:hypothetical protein
MQRAVSLICRRAALTSRTVSISLFETTRRNLHRQPRSSTKIANPTKILSFTPKCSYATQFGNVKEKENNELLPTRSLEELPTILNELKTVCKTPRDLIRALVTLFVQYRVAFGQGTRSAYEDGELICIKNN